MAKSMCKLSVLLASGTFGPVDIAAATGTGAAGTPPSTLDDADGTTTTEGRRIPLSNLLTVATFEATVLVVDAAPLLNNGDFINNGILACWATCN